MSIDVYVLPNSIDVEGGCCIDVEVNEGGPMGRAASQAIGFGWVGAFVSNEVLGGTAVSGAATFNPASCLVYVDQAPTSDAVFTITKNGSPWGSVTIPAGQLVGSVAIAAPTVADTDLLRFKAPGLVDPTLAGLYVTLASA